jgi:hypothetical protein
LNASIQELLATLGSLAGGLEKLVGSVAENVKLTLADFDEFELSQTGQLISFKADVTDLGRDPAAGISGGSPLPKATPGSSGW